jgi:hypothetical protein
VPSLNRDGRSDNRRVTFLNKDGRQGNSGANSPNREGTEDGLRGRIVEILVGFLVAEVSGKCSACRGDGPHVAVGP